MYTAHECLSSQLLFLFPTVAKYKGELLCSVCDKSDSSDENGVVVCDSCFHGNFYIFVMHVKTSHFAKKF